MTSVDRLPIGWMVSTIGDLCERPQYGWTTRAAGLGEGLKLLRTTDITRGPIDWETVPVCAEEPPSHAKYLLSPGDLVVSRAGSVGVSALLGVGPPAVFASYLIRFRPKTGMSARYLVWFLQSSAYWNQISASAAGIALQNVNAKKLSAVSLPVAPYSEQVRIVAAIEEHLSRLDDAVAALEHVRAALPRYRAAVLKAACEGRLVDAPVSGAWGSTTIGALCEVQVGATPSRGRSEYWGGRIPWVSSGEVAFCRIRATRETITREGLESSSTELHPPGTVLLGMIGEGKTRGQAAILDIEACNNQNSAAIRVPRDKLVSEFLYYYLASQYSTTRRAGSGNNQPALNKKRVQSIPLPLPPLEDQHRIVAEVDRRLSLADAADRAVSAGLGKAKRLRQAILKRAFEGKLVPQDPNDEPARVLLERIRTARANTTPRERRQAKRPRVRR